MKPIPYGRQHITDADIAAVVATLQSEFLTQGPQVEAFEQQFAHYIGAQYAVAVANGTAALHLCALALEVGPGTNVITSPITFAASANCVRYCGGQVWFADIDPQTGLLDAAKVEELILRHPRGFFQGIIPVDFAGLPLNLERFRQLAEAHGLWLLEDACHAPGGSFTDSQGQEQQCGNGRYADLAIFSFHPVKHIATGEGGMITTNNGELYQKLLQLRTHGITRNPDLLQENHGGWYYEMQTLGYNYRIPDMLCALGISQLSRAEEGLSRRRQIAHTYDLAFQTTPGIRILNPAVNGVEAGTYPFRHAYHLYVVLVADRKGLYDYLRQHQVFAQVHYIPVHTMPYYQDLGYKKGDFPLAEHYYAQCLSLPMYPSLTEPEQQFVLDTILEWLQQHPN
jgi:UDP-4-amino-4,6-dideoxy-N-acetyl-beta-L-altrosamine transaminase